MTQTVLITGASEGGLGDALAQEYHRRGLRVFAAARSLSKIQHLIDLGLEPVELDVINQESVDAAVEFVTKATGGKLDILVNNAGLGMSAPPV
jgi:1-acylglycerone phosphate reductase